MTDKTLAEGTRSPDVASVKDYLRQYGYYGHAERGMEPFEAESLDLFDTATANALRKYQKFYGLPETGVVDEATAEMMSRPRCGNPDVLEFATFSTKWSRLDLTYAIANNPGNLTMRQVQTTIAQALDLWSAHAPLTFTEVAATQTHDIRFAFLAGDHGDGSPFDGPPAVPPAPPRRNVLAHAFAPPPNGDFAGDVHFDAGDTFGIALPLPANTFDLLQVAAHEVGHALGLDHSSVSTALMFATYHNPTKRNLDPDDIAGIQSLYGNGFLLHTGTALHETNANWDFAFAGNRDLFAINRQAATATELHVLSAARGYQAFALHVASGLHRTDANWSFAIAPNRDLFAIQRRGTNSTEVHVLSASSNYQNFALHTATGLHRTDANWSFAVAPNRDLFAIQRQGTNSTEVHVLSASSNYQSFILHAATGLHRTNANWSFALAPNRRANAS